MVKKVLVVSKISAKGVKNIGSSSNVCLIARIFGSKISEDPQTQETTVCNVDEDGWDVDKNGKSHAPRNFKFTIDEKEISENLNLVFELRRKGSKFLVDKDIWRVEVPVKELLCNAAGQEPPEYPVWNPSNTAEGTLKFSCKFESVSETGAGWDSFVGALVDAFKGLKSKARDSLVRALIDAVKDLKSKGAVDDTVCELFEARLDKQGWN